MKQVTKKMTEVSLVTRKSGPDASRSTAVKRSKSQVPRKALSLKESLITDYGRQIHHHMKKLESETDVTTFLSRHDVAQDYRAKMVDWMVEVLSTFKMSEHTFFVAVSLLDRFFKKSTK